MQVCRPDLVNAAGARLALYIRAYCPVTISAQGHQGLAGDHLAAEGTWHMGNDSEAQ